MSRALILLLCITCVLWLGCAVDAARPLFVGSEGLPSDALILFFGDDLANWVYADSGRPAKWAVQDGHIEVRGGSICTRQTFTDFQLHLEFWVPLMPGARGQERGNSGVFLQGSYEIQVLDSYGLKSKNDDCGAVYGVAAPLVNASSPTESWQTYDIFFHAPRFDDKGNKIANAKVSVLQNGVWIQEATEIPGPTTSAMVRDVKTPGPIMLQDHGCKVRYRNIWIRRL